jgi:hypothetical protein
LAFSGAALLLAGCVTSPDEFSGLPSQTTEPLSTQAASGSQSVIPISQEAPGNYFVGRRMYRRAYYVWGWIRKPRQPWNASRLVMLNENRMHAPDRDANAIGYDNNYEYRLKGFFSGQKVYEPASNGFYPEFVLTGYELISSDPPSIYRDPGATDPTRLSLDRPQ